jgi:hypothetical protein
MDSHGGWIASPVALVRFASAFDDPQKCRILKPLTIEIMFAPPTGAAGHTPNGKPKDEFYACGWTVHPIGAGRNTWHGGLLDGTSTLLVRRSDGFCWAVLFNASSAKQQPADLIDGLMHNVVDKVKTWPTHDLFGKVK